MTSRAKLGIRGACVAAPLAVASLLAWSTPVDAACAGALARGASPPTSPVNVRAVFPPDVVVELCDIAVPADGSYTINWLRNGTLAFSKQVYLTAGTHSLGPTRTYSWPSSEPGIWQVEIVNSIKQRVVDHRTYVIDTSDSAVRTNAYVRAEPSISAERLTMLPRGTRLRVTGRSGDWLRVVLADEQTGFIFSDLVESRRPKARRVTVDQRYLLEGHPLDFACEKVEHPVTEVTVGKVAQQWTDVTHRCQAQATTFYYDVDGVWVDVWVTVDRTVLENNHPQRGFVKRDHIVRVESTDAHPVEKHVSYKARSVLLAAGAVAVRLNGDALTVEKTDASATEGRWQRWLSGIDETVRRYKDCRLRSPKGPHSAGEGPEAYRPTACENDFLEKVARISCALNVNVGEDNGFCRADTETLTRNANIDISAVE